MNRDNSYLIGNKFASGNKPNATSFKKGQIPWNNGKSGLHLSPRTEFKRGVHSIRWVPAGTVKIRFDKGSKTKRRWIKYKDDFKAGPFNWMELSKYLWIKNRRKLVKGMCLHHINNDSLDDRVENLMLVSRKEHPKLHNRWNTKNVAARRLAQGVLAL